MKFSRQPPSTPRNLKSRLAMPLALQAAVEAVFICAGSFALILGVCELARLAGASADSSFSLTLGLAAQIWLSILGVPFHLHVHMAGVDLDGVFSLVPLGLTFCAMIPWWFAGRRLARASAHRQFWQAFLVCLLVQAVSAGILSKVSASPDAHSSLLLSIFIPLIPMGLAFLFGAYWQSRSVDFLTGLPVTDWLSRASQNSRWMGSYFWAITKAAAVALLALLGLSALVLSVVLLARWADQVTVYEQLGPGIIGGIAITVGQLGYLPNLVVWTLSYLSGAGFNAGVGAPVAPLHNQLGELPAVPALAAIPHGFGPLCLAVVLLPVAAGFLGGWWFYRAGENHVDEWLAVKSEHRWLTWGASCIITGIFLGFLAMLGTMLVAAVASGGAGFGRLTEFGADPILTGWYVGIEVAVGAAIGVLTAPKFEHE